MSISMLSVMHYVPLHNFIGMLWAIRAPPPGERQSIAHPRMHKLIESKVNVLVPIYNL